MNAKHPEQQALSDYVSGKLDEQDAAVVESHLADCEACEVTLQAIEANGDTLLSDPIVAGLREQDKSPTEIFAREAEYQRAIDQAMNLPEVTAIYGQPTAISATPPGQAVEQPLQKLGPYELLAKLGEGGMGAVYKAQHEHLGKTVAVKILPATALRDPALVSRFRREMKAVGALHHPNIVGAHDAGEANGVHFLVMEYVAGRDLAALLKLRGTLSIEQAISCTLQTARGLEFAHRKGIVHRDIKPANLLLDEEGTLKILDMGLARLDDNAHNLAAQQGLTQTGQVMGTVDYMAPEQAFDTHRADAKADVYSLGCTLYRVLTGQNVFAGDTIVQKILAHREQPIPSLRTLRPEVSKQLDDIYQRMMAKQPENRISMAEVVQELVALQSAPPTPATQSFTLPTAPATVAPTPATQSGGDQKKPPRKWLVAGLGAAAAAAILLTIVFIIRDKDGREIARVNGPEGSSATVQRADTSETKSSVPPANPLDRKSNLPNPQQADPQLPPANKVEVPKPADKVSQNQKLAFEQPDFAAWAAEVGRREPEAQVALVIKKLQELNPGYDGQETHRIQNNEVQELDLPAAKIVDLSPVRALTDLKTLKCVGEASERGLLQSLAPLQGMKLENLDIYYTRVEDLSPLRGMALTNLSCFGTGVKDLAPLEHCKQLKKLICPEDPQLAANVTALQNVLPNCKIIYNATKSPSNIATTIETDEAWETRVTRLAVADQLAEVTRRLIEKNPGLVPEDILTKEEHRQIVWLKIKPAKLVELSPIRGLPQLRELICADADQSSFYKNLGPLRGIAIERLVLSHSQVADLAPLAKLPLTELVLQGTQVVDLQPLRELKLTSLDLQHTAVDSLEALRGLPLESLNISQTRVTDLAPLRGSPLKKLNISFCKIHDLSDLKELPLEDLQFAYTSVSDLSPLQGMKIQTLNFENAMVSDLRPLSGMPLKFLWCNGTNPCTDYTPLKKLPLETLRLNYNPERDEPLLKSIPTLKSINLKPAKHFLAEGDAK
jgi:serine/threonine protein kinase